MARRRTFYVPVMIAAALTMACLVALLALSQKSEASFPGKNGRIAFEGDRDTGGLMEMRLITQEWGPRGGEARGRIAQEAGSTPSVAFRTVIRRDESRAGRSALGAVVRRRYVALTIFGYSSPKSIWQSSPIHRGRLR